MFGLRIDHTKLSRALEPLAHYFDGCWWYLGGAGVSFPVDRSLPQEQQLSNCEMGSGGYDSYVDDDAGYRVGKPGWFQRYIDFVDTDWAVYLACESSNEEIPRSTLDWIEEYLSRDGVDWFGHVEKWGLPNDVVVVCRDVDNAYWDLFFRDHPLVEAVQNHMRRMPEVNCSTFVQQTN